MALTAEDVLNKTFTQTQFRRGYDEREVDDFLDEVVAEMRRMVKENEDLRARVQDGGTGRPAAAAAPAAATASGDNGQLAKERDALLRQNEDLRSRLEKEQAALADVKKRLAEQSDAKAADAKAADARAKDARSQDDLVAKAQGSADERIATVNARAEEAEKAAQERIAKANADAEKAVQEAKRRRDEAEKAAAEAQARAAQAPQQDEKDGASTAAALAGGAAAGGGASGLIALAQRLHDEHVAEGQAQRDKLITDAKAEAAAIISEAETRGREEVARLDRERTTLEGRITELRNFERDYRSQLRGYIEGKLRDLETTATTTGATPVSAIGL